MSAKSDRLEIAKEAKAIVALAFRNGPIEDLHAGKPCPTCSKSAEFSRISDAEMKMVMKSAVDKMYALLLLKRSNPELYAAELTFGSIYAASWDEPRHPKLRKILPSPLKRD